MTKNDLIWHIFDFSPYFTCETFGFSIFMENKRFILISSFRPSFFHGHKRDDFEKRFIDAQIRCWKSSSFFFWLKIIFQVYAFQTKIKKKFELLFFFVLIGWLGTDGYLKVIIEKQKKIFKKKNENVLVN